MKKMIAIFTSFILLAFTACGTVDQAETRDGIKIVCTTFPQYDWLRNIIGDIEQVELSLLLDSGVDLHSFQPTANDIIEITTADVFVYVGGESDNWVEDILESNDMSNTTVVSLMNLLGDAVKQEQVIEGMQADDHDHDEEDDYDEDDHEDEDEYEVFDDDYDEHVWLSLVNAQMFCTQLSDILCNLDVANAQTYTQQTDVYLTELADLHAAYQTAVAEAENNTLLFCDRFPFRYLVDDYQLNYYAAFAGCSAETEASFETIRFLAEKIDALGLQSVLILEGTEPKIAQTVIQSTADQNQSMYAMNSMQTISAEDIENHATYLGVMRDNLEALKLALQ